MTAVLNELRALDAARARGEIDQQSFARTRARLLATVEEAQLVSDPESAAPKAVPAKPASETQTLWHIFLFLSLGFGICTGLAAWILGDLSLALTLSATLMAALTVRAFMKLKDD